jgi:UDP:flavonoid glycosyltransferase YjiC (YdhE family)
LDDRRLSVNRFLFAMWEGGGTVPPELGIAGRLIDRDHQVHIIGDPTIEPAARRVGATFPDGKTRRM